jgi:predicted nucleotidyltransferase
MLPNVFIATPKQLVLDFISRNYTYEYYDSEVFRELKTIGRASVNNALRELERCGLVERTRKGKIVLNRVRIDHPLVREFKKLRNLSVLFPLIQALQCLAEKVILFGSQAAGTNLPESDIDLFVVSDDKKKIYSMIDQTEMEQQIQAIVYNSSEYLKMPKREPELYAEVMKGIVVWER